MPYQANSAFEHAQNIRIHIILHLCQASSGHLLSILLHPMIMFAGSEDPNETARMHWPILAIAVPKTRFRMAGPYVV